MPSTEIFVLLSIALAVWFWVDTLKARETGIAAVRAACNNAGLQLLDDTDLRAALPSLDLPIRLLHGADDALIPASAAVAMSDALPQGRLTLLDDCGHAPHLSRPDDCAALMEGFLAEHDR